MAGVKEFASASTNNESSPADSAFFKEFSYNHSLEKS